MIDKDILGNLFKQNLPRLYHCIISFHIETTQQKSFRLYHEYSYLLYEVVNLRDKAYNSSEVGPIVGSTTD